MGGVSLPSRLRRRLSPALAGAVFGAAVLGAAVLGAPTSGAVPVVSGGFGGFEIDGDMQAADGSDWSSVGVAAVPDDATDSGFQSSGELKPSTWTCNAGGDNPKGGNIQRAYVRPRVDAGGQFLDLAWVREASSGEANIAFEFNQVGTAGPAPTSGSCGITRTPGDLLVTYHLSNNSQIPDIQLYAWSSTPAGNGDEGSWVDQNLTSAAAFAAVNTTAIADIAGGELSAGRFGEATINVGTALPATETCSRFGVVNVRSRSSNSIDATLQDRLPTTGADVSNCGSIRVLKDDDLDAPVTGAIFEVSRNGQAVGSCTTAAGMCQVTNLLPGQYSVHETSAPTGYVLDDTVESVTVVAGQTATVLFTNFKVKYDLDITEGGENLVGTTRTFIVTARSDTGSGFQFLAGATPVVALVPGSLGSISDNTCDDGTSLLGTCTVTVTSTVPGGSTVEASLAGAETLSADNIWLDYRVRVTPATDEHPVDTEQTFTVALQVDRGAGFGPAANKVLDLDLDGAGSIVGGSGSCTTVRAGTCLVTATSSDAGTSVLTATHHAVVGGTSRDFPGVGQKTWIAEDEIETPIPNEPPTTTDPPAQDPPAQDPPAQDPAAQNPAAQNPPAPVSDVSLETAGDVSGRLEPPVTPAAPSPVNLAELPRTGAGIREETLLALVMLLTGLSARVLGRRRPTAV